MMPLTHILTLLTALVLMACSQEPPPGIRLQKEKELAEKQAATTHAAESPSPTDGQNRPRKDNTIHVKPSRDPDLKTLVLAAMKKPENTHWRWDQDESTLTLKWTFLGLDAKRLFWYTQLDAVQQKKEWAGVDSEVWSKATPHYLCEKVMRPKQPEFYACSLSFHTETFAVIPVAQSAASQKKELEAFQPLILDEPLEGAFLKFSANTADNKTPFFQVHFLAPRAQELYDRIPRAEGPSRYKSGGLRRFGEHLTCEKVTVDGKEERYCILFGSLSTGSFEKIDPK